jgi:hypothetical protein
MKTLLSYCSAKVFVTGLLPMAARSPPRTVVAVNDNDPWHRVGFSIAPCEPPRKAASRRVGYIIAAAVLVTGITALPLIQCIVVTALTTSAERPPDVIRGSPIAPVLLQHQDTG